MHAIGNRGHRWWLVVSEIFQDEKRRIHSQQLCCTFDKLRSWRVSKSIVHNTCIIILLLYSKKKKKKKYYFGCNYYGQPTFTCKVYSWTWYTISKICHACQVGWFETEMESHIFVALFSQHYYGVQSSKFELFSKVSEVMALFWDTARQFSVYPNIEFMHKEC